MGAVGWAIVLALPLYAVLQLLLIVVLGRRFEIDEGALPTPGDYAFTRTTERNGPTPGSCRECGADNDPFYRYCRRCVGQLPARRP